MTMCLHDAEPISKHDFRNNFVLGENFPDGTRQFLVMSDREIDAPWVTIWQDKQPVVACLVARVYEGQTIAINLDKLIQSPEER